MFRIRNLPIKWKLTLWSTTLVFILFILYSALQFIVINKWTIDYEQKQINRQVTEIAAYFQDKMIPFRVKHLKTVKIF